MSASSDRFYHPMDGSGAGQLTQREGDLGHPAPLSTDPTPHDSGNAPLAYRLP
jgi:hypothetical protein